MTIPEAKRDPHLAEKFKAAWPGIVHWMFEGCLRWQREGLEKPADVEAATREYLESEDTMLTWIEECCELGKSKYALAGELFAPWKSWAERNNEFVGSAKALSQKLKDHGESTSAEGLYTPAFTWLRRKTQPKVACRNLRLHRRDKSFSRIV